MDRKYKVLIIYDVSDNKQRRNYVKILNRFGNRVQYSAFEAVLSEKHYKKLINKIGVIHRSDDCIRVYKMYMDTEISCFGDSDSLFIDLNDDIII